jgi:hypothetical protein
LSLDANTSLRTCGEPATLCRIEVLGAPASGDPNEADSWIQGLAVLKKQLEDKYGRPTGLTRTWPEQCRGDALLECLKEKQAYIRYTWSWVGGHRIRLWLGREDSRPILGLRYETSAARKQASGSAQAGDAL